MSVNIQTSKSLLAKLLAAENITVSHQNTKTAYFDLKTRTLVCPVWKDMDGALYDLLMGHEVGHALNTPEQGWHSVIHDENGKPLKKFKGFLNVIEDARIEKLVKRKFPGLAKSFAAAYKSLYDRDFFGIKNVDVNKLNLIDRINIRYKLGNHIPVLFNDEERVILADLDKAESWEEVVEIASRVFDYCKQKEQKDKINNENDLLKEIERLREEQHSAEQDPEDEDDDQDDESDSSGEFSANNSPESEESGSNDESDESEDGSSDEGDADAESSADSGDESEESEETANSSGASDESSDEDSDEDSDLESNRIGGGSGAIGESDGEADSEIDPQSVTDNIFRQREQDLVNETGRVFMIELPETNLSKIIVQNKHVIHDLEKWLREQIANPNLSTYGRNGISYEAVAKKCVSKFNANNKKFIMHILKEFEMRKKAFDYARIQTAKTGELNLNILHNYKFTNDLFKKISVVPKGKSHGMVMYVDMSGSMRDIFRNTIEQCLVLVSFCRLAKIPFDVYGFSNGCYSTSAPQVAWNSDKFIPGAPYSSENTERYGYIHGGGNFHLKHLIGSGLSQQDYRRSFENLCIVANEYMRGEYNRNDADADADHGSFTYKWEPSGLVLKDTPFLQTLLASRDMINKFRNQHKLDIVNVIYLTDGVGNRDMSTPYSRGGVVYLVDKKTKKKIRVTNEVQDALTELVRDVTGCKHLGFYLVDATDRRAMRSVFHNISRSNMFDIAKTAECKKQFREMKFVAAKSLGYDKYFYVKAETSSIKEEKIGIKSGMSMNKMVNLFSKAANSKKTSRALVTQFAEEISASLGKSA